MNQIPETVSGSKRAWNLLEKLGEGDAGEVYRVESILSRQPAILKRPRKTSFASDAIRQAAQIEREAQVLSVLSRIASPSLKAQAPLLLDQGKPGSEFSERFYIIVTPAQGFSLAYLARVARFASTTPLQPGDPQPENLPEQERRYVENIASLGRLPDLLILKTLAAVLDYLEASHTIESEGATGRSYGIIWNDIKPDHIFFDPSASTFTLIDWGNAQFLDNDGASKDRLHSRMDDYHQFLSEMGSFVADSSHELFDKLNWPAAELISAIFTEGIQPLRDRILEQITAEEGKLATARDEEANLLLNAPAGLIQIDNLADIRDRIIAAGELPDNPGAELLFSRLGQALVADGDLLSAAELCRKASHLHLLDQGSTKLLTRLAEASSNGHLPPEVLLTALTGDWLSAFWELRRIDPDNETGISREDWYSEFRILSGYQDQPRPKVALNRLIHCLQSISQSSQCSDECATLLNLLKEQIHPRWSEVEPDPPDSGINYREIETLLDSILKHQPEAGNQLVRSLVLPRLTVSTILEAWERRDLEAAGRDLRRLLLLDPDRARVFLADRAIRSTPEFLAEVGTGLLGDETMQDFITRLELTGRELRNHVGPAEWLDSLLAAFKQLRKGADPTDVLIQYTAVRDDLSWLAALEPRRPMLASPDRPLMLERLPRPSTGNPLLLGIKESPLGKPEGIMLSAALDMWVPEARGSSARLFVGKATGLDGDRREVAMKLMRPDRIDYALPLFSEEARILSLLRDVPGVVPMLECGFIKIREGSLPDDDQNIPADNIYGEVLRYGVDVVHNFLSDLEKRARSDWIPYLAIEKMERPDNLLLLCDTGHTRGQFLPLLEGLVIAQQICDILEVAHTRSIVYRDHKILHYYWQSDYNSIFMIDWNVAKRYPNGLSPAEIQFDLVQFGARSLHYIFTGRPAPGALPMGPNRPEEIEAAERSYSTYWTYDDQRLPKDIKDLLEAILSGSMESVQELRERLRTIYNKFIELI